MNTSQCVRPLRPLGCPNSGSTSVSAKTSLTFTCVSFHLKINTPSGDKTRKHSAKPRRRSSRQSGPSLPYLAASQLFGPARSRCGGSNATKLNVPSGNGMERKSICTSGSMRSVRVPSGFPWDLSVTVRTSWRRSPKTTSGCSRLSHIMRPPQHGSRTRACLAIAVAPMGSSAENRRSSGSGDRILPGRTRLA